MVETNVTNTLSRKDGEEESSLSLISFPTMDWVDELKLVYANDEQIQELITQLKANNLFSLYTMRGDLLFLKNRLYIPSHETFKTRLVELS